MKKTTLLLGITAGIAIALLAGLGGSPGTASADGGPHIATGANATPDKCAGCHRIHTGQNEYLLKEAGTVEDFCYSCHGNGGPGSDLAVQEGTYYGSGSAGLRAGGFDTARIDTTDPNNAIPAPTPVGYAVSIGVLPAPATVNSRHTLETATTLWGNGPVGTVGAGPAFTLECTTCHDPHGNGNYRILRTVPTGSGGAGFAIPDTYGSTYDTANYFNMNYGALPAKYAGTDPPPAGASILVDSSRWCAQCHTRYLARGGRTVPPAADASRADSGDDIFTYRHTSAGWSVSVPTPPPGGGPAATPSVSYVNRACITCHASHGSNSSMPGNVTEGTDYSGTVEWPDGTLTNPTDPERASMLKMDNRGMCKKCHSAQ
jgi:predicted CXXCH cytochrome family protein